MSIKQRVCDLSTEVATKVAKQLIEIRMKQLSASLNSMGTVDKVEGSQITLNMPDGSQRTVTNAGGRIVGEGDSMMTDGNKIGF